ncbi:MAG: serine hydrolase domain-containing protein [Terriglobales bacterium]
MRTISTWIVAAALAVALLGAAPAARAAAPLTRQQKLSALLHSLIQPGAPGLAVLVRYRGRTVFRRGYGMRDLRSGLPVTPRTDFRLASCTKQFTAMAIMLLVQAGKLRYDEPLTEVFPHFPGYGAHITIRELLNHTSGLQSYGDWMAKKYAGQDPWAIPQIHDAGVLRFEEAQTGTEFEPGSEWKYSNGGYCVLGMCIVRASGMSYPAYLRQHIFLPLRMNHTLAYVYGGPPVPQRAYGYTLDAGRWMESDQDPTSATLGDGGVYTSIADLTKWDRALYQHTLLSAAAMQPAITPPHLPGHPGEPVPIQGSGWGVNLQTGARRAGAGIAAQYGFGWFLNPWHGHARMWHEGETVGFRSVIMRFPQDRLSVILLANRVDLNLPQLAERVAGLFLSPAGQ